MKTLEGKKTYIVAALLVVKALLSWLSGDATVSEALDMIQLRTGLCALRAWIVGASGTRTIRGA